MGLTLHIPPCVSGPDHPLHPPPFDRPLRIQIGGPVVAIHELLPSRSWHADPFNLVFPQPAGQELARLAYQDLCGRDVRPEAADDKVVRDEFLDCVTDVITYTHIDYSGVTFDHLVPAEITIRTFLEINKIELERNDGQFADGVASANEGLLFPVDLSDHAGKKVLAVPRRCQERKGSSDGRRINSGVAERELELKKASSLVRPGAPELHESAVDPEPAGK